MRIWLVNHYATVPSRAGGIRHHTLARELERRGHDVLIVASGFDHVGREQFRARQGFEVSWEDGVRFAWIPTPGYGEGLIGRLSNMAAFGWRSCRGPLSRPPRRPDVIVGSSPHLLAALAAQRLATYHDAAFVFELRDLWPESAVALGQLAADHPLVRAARALERRMYRSSDHIVTLLPNAAGYLERFGINESLITWVPNGVQGEPPGMPNAPSRRDRETFRFLYAGSHGPPNGLDLLLDAAAILQSEGVGEGPRIVFDLCGSGIDKERLMKRADVEGIANVRFLNSVPKGEVWSLLQAADALIAIVPPSPLYEYGISMNKIFDYLASGRPILMASSAWNDPVGEADAGITVPSGSASALAAGARTLAAWSPDAIRRAGERGRAHATLMYGAQLLGGRFEAALAQAVARHRRRS